MTREPAQALPPADSLSDIALRPIPADESPAASSREFFGQSVQHVEPAIRQPIGPDPPQPIYGAYILLLLAAYCLTLLYNRSPCPKCSRASTAETDAARLSSLLPGGLTLFTGFLAIGIASLKAVRLYRPAASPPEGWVFDLLPLIVAASAAIVYAIQVAMLKAVGKACLCEKTTNGSIGVKSQAFSEAVRFTTPFLLLAALTSGIEGKVLWIGYLSSIGISVIVFLLRVLRMYAKEKVSILLWFLYLCCVEIIPVWTAIKAVGGII